jgi:hypothetical protein
MGKWMMGNEAEYDRLGTRKKESGHQTALTAHNEWLMDLLCTGWA